MTDIDKLIEVADECARIAAAPSLHPGWAIGRALNMAEDALRRIAKNPTLESLRAERAEWRARALGSPSLVETREQRDALAAQIAAAKAWAAEQSGEPETTGRALDRLVRILSADPDAILREHDQRIRAEVIDSFKESLYQASPQGDFAWIIEAAREHFGIGASDE